MSTNPPLNARQRALQRRKRAEAEAAGDPVLEAPPKTPKSRRKADSPEGQTTNQRTRTRAARAAKVTSLFPDKEPVSESDRAATVPKRVDTIKTKRRTATLGGTWSEIVDRIRDGEYTWDQFVQALTPEELARGQLMDKNGGFGGRPPEFVPRAFFLQCQREIHRRFNEKMQERLLSATDELIELSREGVMDPKDRAKTLIYLMERVVGPVPKEVIVSTEKPYEGLFAKIASGARPAQEGERSRYANRRRDTEDGE